MTPGQQGPRRVPTRGLTCQQQQQFGQALLVQVQRILLPTGLLLLRPQGLRVSEGHVTPGSSPGHPVLGTHLGCGSCSYFQGSQEARLVTGHPWDEGRRLGVRGDRKSVV